MIFDIFIFGLVLTPPRIPPPISKTKYGDDGEEWSLCNIDHEEGYRKWIEYYNTYEDDNKVSDFPLHPYKLNAVPQMLLALKKNEKTRAIVHTYDFGSSFNITTVATPVDEFDICKILIDFVKKVDELNIDQTELRQCQPRWYFSFNYYLNS
mgnify:CR=1 FL=1|tara:strand:- start:1734 stop:2189 length:456 start_codon:yes stop_codon:yes gene_type:complete